MSAKFPRFRRGDLVVAIRDCDPEGANVKFGDLGVVFEEAEFHEPGTGPMVRWFRGGACNVYDGWAVRDEARLAHWKMLLDHHTRH